MNRVFGNRKGFLFSVAVLILLLPLIVFTTVYKEIPETEMRDAAGRARCDKIHYFVEDIKRDMGRALEISTKWAMIAAYSHITESGVGLENYKFNCTLDCEINCSEFEYDMTGSTAALTELIICGTLYGRNNSKMTNHTFPLWYRKIINYSERMNYQVDLEILSMELGQVDAWNVYSSPLIRWKVQDVNDMCYYEGVRDDIDVNTSITGVYDPLYPLNTKMFGSKMITNCSINISTERIAGCSNLNLSNGSCSGTVLFLSPIAAGDKATYCTDHADEIDNQILVIDQGGGSCNNFEQSCFNTSADHHFAGVVDYYNNNYANSFVGKCNITIPWITATCKMDNVTGHGPGVGCTRPPGCDEGNITSNDTCIYIETNEDCNIHRVGLGLDSSKIKTECYTVSDINESYNSYCNPIDQQLNGPSYLDRLDGRLNLSQKYVKQTRDKYNTTLLGIETLVDVYYIDSLTGTTVNETSTWIDYLFWQGIEGCAATSVCVDEGYILNLDCPHGLKYDVSTECKQTGCCGDGTCGPGEDYVHCDDCLAPPACPSKISLNDCKTCWGPGGNNCNVTYNVTIQNSTVYMNLSANPQIAVTNNSIETNTYIMQQVIGQTGVYEYTVGVFNKNTDKINATVYVQGGGGVCLDITNSTEEGKVKAIGPDC
ncbi:MAG: hypothetical protein B6U72_02835 [Candidatus Altiarchaeales archaeon ex4484_2]|nr:MAG: hypothetical protein B6U72_02835 [Candidatus Altiarchaeales archaeon ex4484_2]